MKVYPRFLSLLFITATMGAACFIPTSAITSFTASPTVVDPGQSTELTWTTYLMGDCTLIVRPEGESETQVKVKTADSLSAAVDVETEYSLHCKGSHGISYSTLTVAVREPAARVVYFIATPATISGGQSSVLSWETVGAASCVVSPGDIPVSAGESSLEVTPAATTTYSLACQDALGGTPPEASSQLTIVVSP